MVLNDFHCHLYTYDSGAVMDKIITLAAAKNIIQDDIPGKTDNSDMHGLTNQQKEISVGLILNNIREKSLWESGTDFCLSRTSSPPGSKTESSAAMQGYFTAIGFIGIHPWDSAKADEETINNLEEISSKTGAFIGEFGFDKLKGADKEKQLYLFRRCLEIALKSEKPFTIHCVRSWGLLAEELQKAKRRIKAPFIIHAYNGSAEVVKTITALGGYPSFGLERYGAFSRKAEDSILKTNLKNILFETDFTCYSKRAESGSNDGTIAPDEDNDSENSINVEYSREDNYYGKKYIKRLFAVYNAAASVLKIDLEELSGVIEENGKIFKAYTINRK